MALLFVSTFAKDTISGNVEWTTSPAGGSYSTTTTRPNSDAHSFRCNAGAFFGRQNVFTADQGTIGYIGAAVYIHSALNANGQMIRWSTVGNVSVGNITLTPTNTLVLLKSNGVQIGSASAALSLDTWYYVEFKNDATAATGTLEARLNGSVFATGLNSNKGSFGRALVGIVTGAQTTNDIFFTDVKISDNSGSAFTGYPGSGNVLLVAPNGAGESTQWTIGGSAAAATNWQSVSEGTPDDGTTLVNESLLNKEDIYTLSSSGIHSYDTINYVAIGCRFNNDTADAVTNFKYGIEKVSGGTKLQTAAITPNSTAWRTNTIAAPDIYPLVAYTDPDGAAWVGGGTMDTARLEIIAGTVGVNKIQVTNMWAYIDYTPGIAPVTSPTFITYKPPWRS